MITVAWCRVDDLPGDAVALNSELRIAERAWPDDEQRRIVGARVALVAALGRPDAVLHQRCDRCGGPHGRPVVLLDGRRGPHVSLAHAGAIAIAAVAPVPVGIDVEPRRDDIDVDDWVRTEAIAKAAGRGLDELPLPRARVRRLAIADGYVAAVATLGRRPMRVRVTPL